MGQALAQLPAIEDQHRFNRERWDALMADSFLASLEYKIETDSFGHILMMPPPGFFHSHYQAVIMERLRDALGERGRARPECPLSTSGGVKGVDVIWISRERLKIALEGSLLTTAPEICVEVVSPSNTLQELREKKRLYFEAGADEVWICGEDGSMSFFLEERPEDEAEGSRICPVFPQSLPRD